MKAYLALAVATLAVSAVSASAQAPGIISHQGKLTVNGTNYTGTAQFKFALVNAAGSATYWSDDGTSIGGGAPVGPAISLTVTRGIFSVSLGDPSVANMTQVIPSSVFTNSGVYLRVWVNDGPDGWQQLSPDRQILSVGYAMAANTVSGTVPPQALPSGAMLVSVNPQDPGLLSNGYRYVTTVPPPPWVNGSTIGAPSARSGHSAIWDGQHLLVWGGNVGSSLPSYVSTGGIYDPSVDQWSPMSTLGAPDPRAGHTTVWTGSNMIVWGGTGSGGFVGTGGNFTASMLAWSPVTTNLAPSARDGHVAVWTGSAMFLWGGHNPSGPQNDGYLYDPVADLWTVVNVANPPQARYGATAVWAGDRVIVWGGFGASGALNDGGELLFSGGVPSQWIAMTTSNAPGARLQHTAVWTGSAMIVWGGDNGAAFGDGGIFNPSLNSWSPLSSANAPAARFNHGAVWTGAEMLILDGNNGSDLASAAAYDPIADHWRTLTAAGSPLARTSPGVAWTGTAALVFGGTTGGAPDASLQSLVPQPPWYFYSKL